jgi:hypothetical protein
VQIANCGDQTHRPNQRRGCLPALVNYWRWAGFEEATDPTLKMTNNRTKMANMGTKMATTNR